MTLAVVIHEPRRVEVTLTPSLEERLIWGERERTIYAVAIPASTGGLMWVDDKTTKCIPSHITDAIEREIRTPRIVEPTS